MRNRTLRFLGLALLAGLLVWNSNCRKVEDNAGENGEGFQGKYDVQQLQYYAEGNKGIVVGSSYAQAVRAGLEVLQEGGSAVDSALATSLGQIALAAGSSVSYAGALTMVYYEAETGKIYTLNGRYRTPQQEKDPLSIPPRGTPSGRSTLVPGFMAALQEAYDRFGLLPLERIFEPAIYFAEKGFVVTENLNWRIQRRKDVLMRMPETREVFMKSNGELYGTGDIFVQPQLAETLKKVAQSGADYMYRGEWARKFVDIVQREGGKITLKDMRDYKVIWSEPLHTGCNGFDVYTLPPPNFGGASLVEAINLMECAGLKDIQHYTQSSESLYRLIKITRIVFFLTWFDRAPEILKNFIPGGDFSPGSRLKKETARQIWNTVETGEWNEIERRLITSMGSLSQDIRHSAAVVAVDERGNIAAVEHTINTNTWGTTGIFVDGVSIPDSACFQQQLIYRAGRGNHLPDPTNPCLVMQNNLPVLATSAVGRGLNITAFLNLHNFLDFGMAPKESVEKEIVLTLDPDDLFSHILVEGALPDGIIQGVRDMGQPVTLIPVGEMYNYAGYWTGVKVDHTGGKLYGAASFFLDGYCHAEGY